MSRACRNDWRDRTDPGNGCGGGGRSRSTYSGGRGNASNSGNRCRGRVRGPGARTGSVTGTVHRSGGRVSVTMTDSGRDRPNSTDGVGSCGGCSCGHCGRNAPDSGSGSRDSSRVPVSRGGRDVPSADCRVRVRRGGRPASSGGGWNRTHTGHNGRGRVGSPRSGSSGIARACNCSTGRVPVPVTDRGGDCADARNCRWAGSGGCASRSGWCRNRAEAACRTKNEVAECRIEVVGEWISGHLREGGCVPVQARRRNRADSVGRVPATECVGEVVAEWPKRPLWERGCVTVRGGVGENSCVEVSVETAIKRTITNNGSRNNRRNDRRISVRGRGGN
jgi:hypothetical protein